MKFKEIKEMAEINNHSQETAFEILGDGIAEENGKEAKYSQSILGDNIGEEM